MTDWGTYNVTFTEYMGECPVCGDPDGNCKGDSMFSGAILFDDKPKIVNPRATFIVPRKIYEETIIGKRTVRKLLHPKGAKITPEEARELGLLPPAP